MLDEILKELVGKAIKEERGTKKPVGMISEHLRQEYVDWREKKDDLEAEAEFKLKRLIRKAEKQVEEEYGLRLEQVIQEKRNIWERIENELNLSSDHDLNINIKTGVVSEYIKE